MTASKKKGRKRISGLIRTNITITKKLWELLLRESQEKGTGASTLLRQILEERYESKLK